MKKPTNTRTKPAAHRQYSSQVLDGADRAASRAMLYAVGFEDNDLKSRKLASLPPGTW